MIVDLRNCRKFTGGDKSNLRELLNPLKTKLRIRYSLAHATVRRGKKTLPHKLKSPEVYYIIQGSGKMHIDNRSSKVGAGTAVYIPPKSVQFIENTCKTELKFLCIVDPAWRP